MKFKHNCDDCIFLKERNGFDYYLHSDGSNESIIIRYSSKRCGFAEVPLHLVTHKDIRRLYEKAKKEIEA